MDRDRKHPAPVGGSQLRGGWRCVHNLARMDRRVVAELVDRTLRCGSCPELHRAGPDFIDRGQATQPLAWVGAGSVSLRDVADDPGELQGARPHRPVTPRQVDVGDVAQLGETPDPRVTLLDGALDLLGGQRRAHDDRRQIEAGVVVSTGPRAGGARLRHRPPPECLAL
jgi:hypothetical protein